MINCGKNIDAKIQKLIVSEYKQGVRGSGKKSLAKKYNISPTPVKNIVDRAKRNRGNPYARRGCKNVSFLKKKKNAFVLIWTNTLM